MSDPLEPYRETINNIKEILKKDFGLGRARALATLIVLCDSYGDGDAWAGLILRNLVENGKELIDLVYEVLEEHGIRVMKPKLKTYFSLYMMIRDATEQLMKRYPQIKAYICD